VSGVVLGPDDRWFSHHLETDTTSFERPMDGDRKKRIWELLVRSEEFDRFLGKKFPNLKRYGEWLSGCGGLVSGMADLPGCEGAESMLPALDTLFELGARCT
jgi:probable 2-oxoglutarate dehydrogenase E1 component DHKTD1